MDLKIKSPPYYAGRDSSSLYKLPEEIGYFSTNSDGKYVDDNHQMKYIAMPVKITDLHMDLNEGYSQYIDVVEDSENNCTRRLKWILSHENEVKKHFGSSSPNPKMDLIVCSRGTLTVISSTIYESSASNDWCIQATKFRSVIYLQEVDTEKRAQLDIELRGKENPWRTYGFKFEQFMTSDAINSKPDTSVPVNENEKQYIVVKGKMDNTRLLLSAEVDGVDPEYLKDPEHDPNSMLRFVELKTSRLLTSEKQKRNFLRYKLIKWYLQSYFVNTPKVICGFRDDEGIVKNMKIYKVEDMPKMAEGIWSPSACLNFCSEFLDYVKKCVVKDDPKPKLDFVCFRGVLTIISKTIYESSEDWMIYASKFRSVIYMRKNDTEQHKQIEMNAGKRGHLWTTYGFKFEQFMTSGEIDSKPNTSVPVNENEKYFTVMKGKFDNHRLLFGAEVDGVDPEHLKDPRQDPKSTLRYVELKTSMLITSLIQRMKFNRYKLLKWYLQSYFIGILRVICGFRDRDGIVRELGVYNVRDMPRMAEGLWSPSACLRFCSEFLNFVKKCAVKDDPKVVYRFYYKPGCNITCEELQIEEERILPDWYTESVKVI